MENEKKELLADALRGGNPQAFMELFALSRHSPPTAEIAQNLRSAEEGKRNGNALAQAQGLLGAGAAYAAEGRSSGSRLALYFLGRAADLAASAGLVSSEMEALAALGDAHEALGEGEQSVACHEAHRALALRAGDSEQVAAAAGALSLAYKAQAEPEGGSASKGEAVRLQTLALASARECGDVAAQSEAIFQLGRAHLSDKDVPSAVAHFQQFLSLSRTLSDAGAPQGAEAVARGFAALAAAYIAADQCNSALDCLNELLAVATATGNGRAHADALEALGLLHAREGRWAGAETSLASAYALRRKALASGEVGSERGQVDKCAILLGLVRGASTGSRATQLFSAVQASNTEALLRWRVSRVELPGTVVPVQPAAAAVSRTEAPVG
jgi:tetratricopeptide (TPR) repeat protein